MATGFQINVDSCAFRALAGLFEGQHFGVFDSFIAVKALAHNDAILHNDGADQRIRLYLTFTFARQRKREIKEIQIVLCVTHYFILQDDYDSNQPATANQHNIQPWSLHKD